jgi:DNA-directed RNA polymerase subunit N (RpoN/RPB10)
MIPVRCFTCGKVIAHKYDAYVSNVEHGMKIKDALDKAGMVRYCCRRMFMCHVNNIDKMIEYDNVNQ